MYCSRAGDDSGRARWINAAAVVVAGCLLGHIPAQAAGGHWTMTAVDGVAMVVVSGDEGYVAQQGHPVTVGCTLVTGSDATVTLMRRGDSITVYPNSELTIPDTSGNGHLGVIQSFGTLLYRMETRESWNFEVRTPYLAATVKGTVFAVAVTTDKAVVTVSEGVVHVLPARGSRGNMVRAGRRAAVNVANVDQVTIENVDSADNPSWSAGRVHGKPARGRPGQGRSGGRDPERGGPHGGDPSGGKSKGGKAEDGDPSGGGSMSDRAGGTDN